LGANAAGFDGAGGISVLGISKHLLKRMPITFCDNQLFPLRVQ
jgi:hypothetical protein